VKGDVIVVAFPFSDFSSSKNRPAVIVATPEGDDVIICQITSSRKDAYSITIDSQDFKKGSLRMQSYVRTNKLLSLHKSLISSKIGMLKENKIDEIIKRIEQILRA